MMSKKIYLSLPFSQKAFREFIPQKRGINEGGGSIGFIKQSTDTKEKQRESSGWSSGCQSDSCISGLSQCRKNTWEDFGGNFFKKMKQRLCPMFECA